MTINIPGSLFTLKSPDFLLHFVDVEYDFLINRFLSGPHSYIQVS